MLRHSSRKFGLAFLMVSQVAFGASREQSLSFRGYLQGYPDPDQAVFWDVDYWDSALRERASEGFSAIVWYGPNEFTNGRHLLVRHSEFPEARELSAAENERLIAHWQVLFARAHEYGLENYLLTQHIFVTKAFAAFHGLLEPMEPSESVSHWQALGYPNFWPGDPTPIHHCGVRNELTLAYTEAVYVELAETYPDLDGFWGYAGEPLPGDRSTFYREAVLPALERASRRPRYVANQWQVTLPGFLSNIAANSDPDQLWLGFHGYNSEQITDAQPYPGVVRWATATGLPTIPDIYPANQLYFPFNSPRFAHQIVTEIRKTEKFAGYLYYERHISGSILGPLFRKALARYGKVYEPWSEAPWIEMLQEEVGSFNAAEHLLRAYDAAARVIPETCALVYSGGDVMRRELRLPYAFFAKPYPWSHVTSPARGNQLVPVRHYARMIALDTERIVDDGSDYLRPPHYQHPVWGSEGGSVYDVTPPEHMRRIRELGVLALAHADSALAEATKGIRALQETRDVMEAIQLLTVYYDEKIAATVAALIYVETEDQKDRELAEEHADEALSAYLRAGEFMHRNLDPYYKRISGSPLAEAGVELPELMILEREDRDQIWAIFGVE